MPDHDKKKKAAPKPGVQVPLKKISTPGAKKGEWSPYKKVGPNLERRERSTDEKWKPSQSETRKEFDKAYAAAKKAGKTTFMFGGEEKSTDIEFRRTKKPSIEKPEKMTPMPTRKVELPGVESKRKVPGPVPVKKPKVAMYAKKKTAISPDWKSQGKGGKAKLKYALAKLSPIHAAKKGPGGIMSTGRYKIQSAVRPVSEKDALTRSGKLKRGVVKTSLGTEEFKGGKMSKRTHTGLAGEEKLKGKKMKKPKKQQYRVQKGRY